MTALYNILMNMMGDGHIVSEAQIRNEQNAGMLRRYSLDEIQSQLSEMLIRNEIRWVAFRGYTRGGRP
jgi:hypothetical protein